MPKPDGLLTGSREAPIDPGPQLRNLTTTTREDAVTDAERCEFLGRRLVGRRGTNRGGHA